MGAKEESVGFPSSASGAADLETLVMPHLGALADFRGAVRGMARQVKATDILAECDKLRDITLPDLGVRLEDKEGEPTVIKLVDKEELRREREEKLALEAAKIPPGEMFRKETDKYSAWDDKGVPTLLADGKEVPKAQQKKLQKLWSAQEKKYNNYLKSQEGQ